MKSFLHSTMDWDGIEDIVYHPCEVRIGEADLVISYTHNRDRHLWRGSSSDGVIFEVSHSGHPADKATLKRTDEFTLEGSWTENGKAGSWRLDLDDEG